MKKAYNILLVALGVLVLSWFLPWLYGVVFPVGGSDPFVAWSPVSDRMIVSENGGDKAIFAVDSTGRPTGETYTREQRDSLLPQIYFTQLMARDAMPDTVAGIEATMANLRHHQWVFSCLPRDVVKVMPEVFPIMESMPVRIDLEDPDRVFRFRDGRVEMIDMATNTVNPKSTHRFTDIFNDRGFEMPMRSFSANITSRKPRDEGYLMVDAAGSVFHMKMQAGRPYMSRLKMPVGTTGAAYVSVMENTDPRHLGVMTDTGNRLYLIEKDGYRICPLEGSRYNPERDRISIVANVFNLIVKVSGKDGTRYTAYDAADNRPLGRYFVENRPAVSQTVAGYIFPYELSFTSIDDSLAKPRFQGWSWHALYLNAVLALLAFIIMRRRRLTPATAVCAAAVTAVCGIFAFIPLLIIKI